jgi:hypothetical protein
MKKKNTVQLVLHKHTLSNLQPRKAMHIKGGATNGAPCEDSYPAESCLYECPTDYSCVASCEGSCGTCVTCAWTTPCYTCCC